MMTEGAVVNGRYRIVREIARGGMAVIWAAQDQLLDRPVALKLLHPGFTGDAEFLERFSREARAAASLAHPNIVAIYDVGQNSQDGTPFIVMELVTGENLKDLVRREAPLPDSSIRSIGATLAETLGYAHTQGVVHRDVKPQNVLLGRDGRPRLTDFGIAQALNASSLTRTGSVMGSVHYLAPEVIRGQPATPQSDLYSLGVVLYEMATGVLPFTADTEMAVALAHVEQPPTPPRTIGASIAPDLEATILRALQKRPTERFSSGAELARALTAPPRAPAGHDQRHGTTARAVPVPATPAVARARPAVRRVVRPTEVPRRGAGPIGLLLALALTFAALGAGFFGWASLSRGFDPAPPSPLPALVSPTAALVSPTAPLAAPTAAPFPSATSEPRPSATPIAPPTPTVPAAPTATQTPRATPTPVLLTLPNVVGQTQESAEAALRQAGLSTTVQRVNVNVPGGRVTGQTPQGGSTLPPGSTVTLSVATGQVPVPVVAGRPEAEALGILHGAGFSVPSVRSRSGTGLPAGTAVGTDPEAGKVVKLGSDVDLFVSNGR